MEDLRKKDFKIYTNHIRKPLKWKEILLFVFGFFVILAIIAFPYNVGNIIGYWFSQFIEGFTNNFKI